MDGFIRYQAKKNEENRQAAKTATDNALRRRTGRRAAASGSGGR
jgi:hypothetical protein